MSGEVSGADPALLPQHATAAAGGGRSRHDLPPDVAARIAEGIPANTRRAWLSRYRRFHAWATRTGYEQPMPPTEAMLAAYIDYLGYDQKLAVATAGAHLGSLMALTRTWVAVERAGRTAERARRAAARAAVHGELDAAEKADAAADPAGTDPQFAARRSERAARRGRLDAEELADARAAAADPQVPDPVLAQKALNGYAGTLARTGAKRGRGKASTLSPEQIRRIVAPIDTSTAAGKRDKALLLIWFATGRRGDETSALYLSDVRFARPHGVRIEIRRSKTNPHGRAHDSVAVPYVTDPVFWPYCPVRALEDWIKYLTSPINPEHPGRGPRYAAAGAAVALWPRIDQYGALGSAAAGRARARREDDGGLSTRALRDILRSRAGAAGVQVDGVRINDYGEEEAVRVSNHSVRRSTITAAAEAGKDPHDVALHVGMRPGSPTLYEYWDRPRDWEHNAAAGLLETPARRDGTRDTDPQPTNSTSRP